jgi:hypothetical protein
MVRIPSVCVRTRGNRGGVGMEIELGYCWVRGGGVVEKGGARVKAACEMPRPCVEDVAQAQGNLRFTKSSLTRATRGWHIIVK